MHLGTYPSLSTFLQAVTDPKGVGVHTREVRTMLETVLAARMCDLTASFPCCRFFFPWLTRTASAKLLPVFKLYPALKSLNLPA